MDNSIDEVSEYSFKPGIAASTKTLRLTSDRLQLYQGSGNSMKLLRDVSIANIRKIWAYGGLAATDPNSGSFEVTYCKLSVRGSRSILLSNASILAESNGTAVSFANNQQADFCRFQARLLDKLLQQKSQSSVTLGQWGGSIAGIVLTLLGIGMLAIGVAIPLTEDSLLDAVIPGTLLCLFGAGVGMIGFGFVRRYWPEPSCLSDLQAAYQAQLQ